jgi:hemolysin activation/secretion protein
MRAHVIRWAATAACVTLSHPAVAQSALDRVQGGAPEVQDSPADPRPAPRVEVKIEPAASAPQGQEVLVGAVVFNGLESLQSGDFAQPIAPYLGQTLDQSGLGALTGAIAARARALGFAFATAWIEPQRLANGVLRISVDEGRIDEIRIDGPESPAVRAALAPLADGTPARLAEVERRLMIAGDIDGVQIGTSRYVREQDRGILLVSLARDPAFARIALSNEGTRPLGPLQLRIDTDFNAVLADDDQLSFSYTGTPADPRELHFGSARYAKHLGGSGTEIALAVSASHARPGSYLRHLDLRSRSWFAGASVLQPLWRRRAASLWLEGSLGLRDLRQWQDDILVRDDRLAVARGTAYGYADFAGGRARASLTLSQGLGILAATESGDPFASRWDADSTFTTLQGWAQWTRNLNNSLSLRVAAQGQLASEPLLVTEETSLGGTGFLRGYDWSERSGDEGVMGLAELRYDWRQPLGMFRHAQIYGFVDGGRVSNIDSNFGSGSLTSAGGGLRVDLTETLGGSVELAVPLSGPRYDTGDEAPRINLRVARSF